MGKKLMSLADLYNYFSTQGKTQRFSCNDEIDAIAVQVSGKINFNKEETLDGLYPTRIQMNFVGDNLNNSRIEMKAQEKALSSSQFRPLLACIHDVDGEPQFWKHNMEIDDNGEIEYIEQPVGVIAEQAHIEHDDEYDMDYAIANGYIWEEYSKAKYILERDQKCDVSVELCIREMSYDAKDKILVLDDFFYCGCTILGYDDDGNKVNPAMPGSNITLADFSVKNDSMKFEENTKLIEVLEKLNNTLSNFNNIQTEDSVEDNFEEGGNQDMFEKLLEQYGKTVEDITFEYENLTDEELEVAFSEAFAEDEEAEPEAPASEEEGNGESAAEADAKEGEASEDDIVEDDETTEEDAAEPEAKNEFSVTINGETKTFSISMNAKIEALSALVNETYADDCTWYSIEAYDDYLVMIDYWNGKAFRQSYKSKSDQFTLKGDRVPVTSMWVTDDERNAFEDMKSKFEDISAKLMKHETEPEKMSVLESEEYAQIATLDEFVSLKSKDAHFDMSVDEVRAKADEMLLSYAKSGSLSFTEQSEKVGIKMFPTDSKKKTVRSRYGGMFKKED